MRRGKGTSLTPLGRTPALGGAPRAVAPRAGARRPRGRLHARDQPTRSGVRDAALAVHASHDFAVALLRDRLARRRGDGPAEPRQLRRARLAPPRRLRRGRIPCRRRPARRAHVAALRGRSLRARRPPAAPRPSHARASSSHGAIRRSSHRWRTWPGARRAHREPPARLRHPRALRVPADARPASTASRLPGYDNEEITHSAVAALVAGRQADAGFGLEAAAAQFGLEFVPVATERYYLAFDAASLDQRERARAPRMRERTRLSGRRGRPSRLPFARPTATHDRGAGVRDRLGPWRPRVARRRPRRRKAPDDLSYKLTAKEIAR